MTDLKALVPGLDHPISIEETLSRVTVTLGGRVIAESEEALTLRESTYPAVQYLPLADVAADVLVPSDHTSYCPYKGKATYYSIKDGDDVVPDAVWTYVEPHKAVADIRDHVAFYVGRVEGLEVNDG